MPASRPKKPPIGRVMPVGVSANALGLTGRISRMRQTVLIGVPVTVVIALAFGSYLLTQSFAILGPKTLTNSTYQYTFNFYKKAEPVNLVQGEGLQYGRAAVAIAKPTSDAVADSCDQVGDHWQTAFKVKFNGQERPVCTIDDKVFLLQFYYANARHFLEVTYTSAQLGTDQSDVRKIMNSMKVSLQ